MLLPLRRGSAPPVILRVRCSAGSGSDDFIKPLNNPLKLFRYYSAKPGAETFGSKRANLADFDPGSLGKIFGLEFKTQREGRMLWLTCQRDGDHSARALIKDIMTENKNRSLSCLLLAAHRVEIGPADVTP